MPYARATELQLAAREALRSGAGPERLLLLEHPHVFTLGRNATESDVLWDAGELAARGVEVCATDRGGQVTYHGPGQLVGYPILDLDPDRRDLRRYVQDLQSVLVATLADLGIAATGGAGERIGVWVGARKIASIGIHLSRWITTHGFALNVAPDLAMFGGIVPCGLTGIELTSIERELGAGAPGLGGLCPPLVGHFARVFGRDLVADPALALGAHPAGARA